MALVLVMAHEGDAIAQGSCLGSAVTIPGSVGDDVLVGTEGDDVIDALGGNDLVAGLGGNDKICLGVGVDVAQGGAGDDRIEGGTEDDLVVGDHLSSAETGSGDDEVVGGEGDDVVIGDVSNEVGEAIGEGDDKLNGGAGNDVLVGDAYSRTVAVGIGEDDIDAGPGSDVVSGDVLVGEPTAVERRGGGVGDIGPGDVVGAGSGGDEINTQTGDDLVVGDALSFEAIARPSARGLFSFPVLARLFCGRRLAGQVLNKIERGVDPQEIDDFVRDTLKAEFDEDFVIGDCANLPRPLRSREEIKEARRNDGVQGGGPDDIKSGNEGAGQNTDDPGGPSSGDIVAGGSIGWGEIFGGDNDLLHLGMGNDVGYGDGPQVLQWDAAGMFAFHQSSFGIYSYERQTPIPPTADVNADGIVDGNDFTVWRNAFVSETMTDLNGNRRAARGADGPQLRLTGGGKDVIRGAAGTDYLEGGAKRDQCKGGGGDQDVAVEKGPAGCEKLNGLP